MIELEHGGLQQHGVRSFVAALGVDEETVAVALQALLAAQVIARTGERHRVLGSLTVDISGGRSALHEIKAHWSRAAAVRALHPHSDDVFGYNVISASQADLERIRELLKRTYREIRAIVACSEPSQRAALVNLQLVNWELRPVKK